MTAHNQAHKPIYCPCLKTKKHQKIQLKVSTGQISPYFRVYGVPKNMNLRTFINIDTHFILFYFIAVKNPYYQQKR